MNLSRRQFLHYAVLASSAIVAEHLGLSAVSAANDLQLIPPGRLSDQALDTLSAFAQTFVDGHGPSAHYRPYFEWRAANLPTYRGVYLAFVDALDETLLAVAGVPFAEADAAIRRDLLTHLIALPDPASGLFDPQPNPAAPQNPLMALDGRALPVADGLWMAFDRLILSEMTVLYLQTNGYFLLGYRGYPGQGRGLMTYTDPINPPETES